MGSTRKELELEPEGPLHPVTLTRGFWLADTPCTQELWQAVTGANPSEFVSPRRPVEQVNWESCIAFVGALATRVAGPGWRLPTEAEWEYACRSGTTTDTWVGDLTILGDNNAPALDAIAWYGGNCGHELDLHGGVDASGWRDKQYLFTRAATREVKGKAPNPWGLYDMLGNVDEWCSDWHDQYSAAPSVDPVGPRTGSKRVVRGGSWYDSAGRVRAAARFAWLPSARHSDIGFRLARGHQ
jgi:formylglycine-generating enzyme required for sulfatase activity